MHTPGADVGKDECNVADGAYTPAVAPPGAAL